MPVVLVVDDERSILLAFRRAFREAGLTLLTAESAAEGLAQAAQHRPDAVILDIQLPDQSGLDVFRKLRALDARTPVIFITGKATTETAIEAMKLGAYDYLFKPLELARLRQVVDGALGVSRMMQVPAVVARAEDVDDRADAIIGRCPVMQEVYKDIGRVAPQDLTVLITGETGTGKELVARAIYQHSPRSAGPFLAINCATLSETLLESELFGHERGAFTGADRQHIGKFEKCNGGTLFLDEVADMSPLTQSKVLRLLQEQTFERLGGAETIRSNVRILAATNQDLQALREQGRFRKDLYYRLNVFSIRLPPLRERGEDLSLLVHHYLHRYSRDMGKHVHRIAPEAFALLSQHPWPGNIRELQSVLKQAVLQARGPLLLSDFLPPLLGSESTPGLPAAKELAGEFSLQQFVTGKLAAGSNDLYGESVRWLERRLLTQVLLHTDGSQRRAARVLGISRGSLRHKLRELRISVQRSVERDDDP
jgi:two-component system nitrogen regulation response regulator GlnG